MTPLRVQAQALLVALLLLGLTACFTATPVNEGLTEAQRSEMTPAQRLFVAEADYLINKADFTAYARQPLCGPGEVTGCHDAGVVVELRALDKKVREAFRVARGAVGADQAVAAGLARDLLAKFSTQVALIALKETAP